MHPQVHHHPSKLTRDIDSGVDLSFIRFGKPIIISSLRYMIIAFWLLLLEQLLINSAHTQAKEANKLSSCFVYRIIRLLAVGS